MPWAGWPPSTTRALLARIRAGDAERARAARARAPVVGGAGGARAPLGRRHRAAARVRDRARRRDEPRRRHPPRRARLRPRLLPVQRRRGRARRAARGGPGATARSWSTATSTRATAPPTCSARTRTRSPCRSTAPATTPSSASRPTSTWISPPGRATTRYLEALARRWTSRSRARGPDFAFYLAGADPWEGDRLGRLALTKAGLRARDELVLDRLLGAGAPVCVVLAGGYAHDVADTVDINAATAAAVARLATTLPR